MDESGNITKEKHIRRVRRKVDKAFHLNYYVKEACRLQIITEIFRNIENLEQASDNFLFLCLKSKAQ